MGRVDERAEMPTKMAPVHRVETEPEDATCAECGNASSVRFPISTRLWRCMACAERQG
jgi:ribosomal protein L37AE/L43A